MIRVLKSGSLSLVPPFIVYSTLSVIILWNLLLPGYILTLDMVFAPTIPFPHASDPVSLVGLPFHLGLWTLNRILPGWLIQKMLLFTVFLTAGLSAYSLCQAERVLGRLFAGFIYILNPFVYVRFMVGHYRLLLGYSIFPFLIKSLIEFADEPQFKRCIKLALLSTLILILDVHFAYIAGLTLLSLLVFKILSFRRSPQGLASFVRWSGVTTAIFIVTDLYWIIPSITFNTGDSLISSFTYQDLLAFTSHAWGTGVNIFFTLASLYGFWRVPEGYHYVSEALLGWQLIYILILFITIYGFISLQSDYSQRRWVSRGITTAGITSLLLATGISSTYTAPIFQALFQYLPFFSGMREPQKFLATLALVYSFLGGHGVSELYTAFEELRGKTARRQAVERISFLIFIIAGLVSPFIYSYTQLFGFNGYLRNLEYPEEWYEAKLVLDNDDSDYRVLILPWHLYMYQSWIGRITANPAPVFFGKSCLAGENMEWMGIETQSRKPEQLYMQSLLRNRDKIGNFGELLTPLNIKYVILLKEVDYQNYDFLYEQKDLKDIFENGKIVLFENECEVD